MAPHKIPESAIDEIIESSPVHVYDEFGCCTVVTMQLPNGYVLVESSGCIDPAEYDRDLGVHHCVEALKRKIWQLEGYRGKQAFHDGQEAARA